jgi:hypothetical protein
MIKLEYPPNIQAIAAVFPTAMDLPTIFAYGHDIYNPTGAEIPNALLAHEGVHCARQLIQGVENWWEQYCRDEVFRYEEELLAHIREYEVGAWGLDRNQRRALLWHTAERLVAPLYQYSYKTVERAVMGIKKGAKL